MERRIERDREVKRRMACHSSEDLDTCATSSGERGEISRLGGGRTRERGKGGLKESKSETNVFVSSLSAVSLSGSLASVLDCSGQQAQSLMSLSNPKTNHYSNTNTTTSVQARRRAPPVDANQNSPPSQPQGHHNLEGHSQYYSLGQDGGHHRNGLLSSEGGLGQRRKLGFEERVPPPRRQQLVRPLCQTETGRGRSLTEPMTDAHQTGTGRRSSPSPSPDSQRRGINRGTVQSSLREPSDVSHLYRSSRASQPRNPGQAAQRETQPLVKQPATARRTSSPSNTSTVEKRLQTQLTYRRNCSSPNRTEVGARASTPPHSPLRTPQGSPRRQPSMYLTSRSVTGVARHPQPGYSPAAVASTQGYGNTGLRPPVKTNICTTGIPKAPVNSQQSPPGSNCNSSPRERSPSPKCTPKPKGVRPKIITYIRKNPQVKPQAADGPYQVSSLPSRLSAYTHNQIHASGSAYAHKQIHTSGSLIDTPKDPSKPGLEPRGAPVLRASNLLYDKYRQEVQMFPSRMLRPPGHTHTVPLTHTHNSPYGHTAPPTLGSKADNFYGPLIDKNMTSEVCGVFLICFFFFLACLALHFISISCV